MTKIAEQLFMAPECRSHDDEEFRASCLVGPLTALNAFKGLLAHSIRGIPTVGSKYETRVTAKGYFKLSCSTLYAPTLFSVLVFEGFIVGSHTQLCKHFLL